MSATKMLIVAIINFLLLVSLYIAIMVSFGREKNTKYEFRTDTSKFMKVLVNVFFIIFGVVGSAAVIAAIAIDGGENNNLPLLITVASIGAFSLLLVYLIYAQFEAIKGDCIYVRRFAKIREIPIKEVRSIDRHSNAYIVFCKNGVGFTMDSGTVGAEDLIKLIRERTTAKLYSISPYAPDENGSQNTRDDSQDTNECLVLVEIGREFRANAPAFKRRQVVTFVLTISLVFSLIVVGGLLIFFLAERPSGLIMVILGIPLFFAYLLVPARIKENIDKDLEHDDEWLGNKYKYQNSKVKGHSRGKFLQACIMLSVLCACSLCIGGVSGGISFSQKPVEESDLKSISGQFEYIRSVSDDYAIGLKDDPVEYRVGSIEESRFNKGFLNEVKPGDVVEIFIEKGQSLHSLNYKERTSWAYAYIIKSDSATYLSYEDYVLAFEINRSEGIAGFVVSLAVFSASAIGLFVSYLVYKRNEKLETISV